MDTDLSSQDSNNQFFSLSFINPIIAISKTDGFDEAVFIFGTEFFRISNISINNLNLSLEEAFYLLGDPTRFCIIELLKRYGRLTASDISRLVNIATSTAARAANTLFEFGILKEDHKAGRKKIYYLLNEDFFTILRQIMWDFTDIERKEEKNEN